MQVNLSLSLSLEGIKKEAILPVFYYYFVLVFICLGFFFFLTVCHVAN